MIGSFFADRALAILVAYLILLVTIIPAGAFDLVRDGEPRAKIYVDTQGTQKKTADILRNASGWLKEAVRKATGAELIVVDKEPAGASIVLARSVRYPDIARQAKLQKDNIDAFAVVTGDNRAYILGQSELAVRHGVATLLHGWGFRYFNPSPRWWITPKRDDLAIKETFAEAPGMRGRRIWYAYGVRHRKLKERYNRWAAANRLGSAAGFSTGHSYGNIVGRNRKEFENHPEYLNMLENGERYKLKRGGRFSGKFCYSNPDLVKLVVADRIKKLEQRRKNNPYAFMVSVDPSDGGGTCHCEDCKALGSSTDRVIYLANQVARGLRKKHPGAWVGLYAYASHRLPPTIEVEPNVYVQVAMAFNRTRYSLPELVSKWAEKVSMLGLREYYGVEHWDWGLPGRIRGASVAYQKKWIPYYYKRNVNAINAESNANWGGQTLGFLVAAHLMWDPHADVAAILDDYYQKAFGKAAGHMRKLQTKFDQRPSFRLSKMLKLFEPLEAAYQTAEPPDVRKRIVDMMAYLHYVLLYRDYSVEASRSDKDAEYAALNTLMQYAWQTRLRGMVHYYALARRLCNAKPIRDGRFEFHMYGHGEGKKKPPVWKVGGKQRDEDIKELFGARTIKGELEDEDIIRLFRSDLRRLEKAPDPYKTYSSRLERVTVPVTRGTDPGRGGSGDFQSRAGPVHAVLVADQRQTIRFKIQSLSGSTTIRILGEDERAILEKKIDKSDTGKIELELPEAGSYPVRIKGAFRLHVPRETPLMFSASYKNPVWINYSGPHYFYVPKGTEQIIFNGTPRLSLIVPGKGRRDFSSADRAKGKNYVALDVPEGADGRVWRTMNQTRGNVRLINIPPYMSFYPDRIVVPKEIAEKDNVKLGWSDFEEER